MDEPKGCIDTVTDDGRAIPLKIESRTIIEQKQLAKNISVNIERGIPRFSQRPLFLQRRNEPLAIVGAGPSLKKTVYRLHEFENVLVCGSAHDYVVRAGIVPTYALVSDGGKEDKGNLLLHQSETIYLIASQCDPGLFDHLVDNKVEMWHYKGQAVSDPEDEAKLLRGEPSIAWGSTVTINSIRIAMMLGFQHLHFFGFDSSYGNYGLDHHCCEIAGSMEYQKVPAKVGDREFITDLGLAVQAEQFFQLLEVEGQFLQCTIHGDGMIACMAKNGDPGLSEYISLVE